MPADNARTLSAFYDTREAADRAVEHLVQQYGLNRADIFVEAEGAENSAGTQVSGGDGAKDAAADHDAGYGLNGRIRISADMELAMLERARAALREQGATEITES